MSVHCRGEIDNQQQFGFEFAVSAAGTLRGSVDAATTAEHRHNQQRSWRGKWNDLQPFIQFIECVISRPQGWKWLASQHLSSRCWVMKEYSRGTSVLALDMLQALMWKTQWRISRSTSSSKSGRPRSFVPSVEYVLVIWDSRYYGTTRPKIKLARIWLRPR